MLIQENKAAFASKLSQVIIDKKYKIRVSIIGESMYPLLQTHDTIIIAPAKISDLLYGDIIVYTRGENLICHRIIKKFKTDNNITLITKGDNSLNLDLPLLEDNIIGKVIEIEIQNRKICLNCISWRIFNNIIATYSVLFLFAYRGMFSLKKSIMGDRNNHFTRFGSKILFKYHNFFRRSMMQIIIYINDIKLKY